MTAPAFGLHLEGYCLRKLTLRTKLLLTAAVATVATLGAVTPAQALFFISIGPYASQEACNVDRVEFSDTYITQPCAYRSTPSTSQGWYFKYAPEF